MSTVKTMSENPQKNRITTALCAVISLCFMLFVYAPFELYFSNKGEFFFDAYMMAGPLLILFLVCTAAGTVFFLIFSKTKAYMYLIALCFWIFVSAYFQGNYMAGSLPHIKGEMIDWNANPAQRISSILLWGSLLIVTVLLIKKCKEDAFLKIVKYISIGITLILLTTFVTLAISNNGFEKKQLVSSTPTSAGILNYSEDSNFLILLLDKVDAAEVKRLFEEDPSYEEDFADFTFFTNAEAAYPYTKHSIPLILTGERYEKQYSYDEYIEKAYAASPLISALSENDYSIGIYETDLDIKGDTALLFDNMAECKRALSSWVNFDKWMCVMTGYRYFPYDLKKFSYLYTNVFNTLKVLPEGAELFDDNNGFLWSKLNGEELTKTYGKNFRFIHIQGAHEWLYDENVNPVENGNYEDSVKASLTITKKYLEKYKNAGAYDNSVIIIMADHGALDPMQQNPVLMIKGFGEKHDIGYNDAPISYDDLSEAYLRLLDGKESTEAFDAKEGDQRERRILFEDDDNNPDHIMQEFIQTGHAGETDTLTLIREF